MGHGILNILLSDLQEALYIPEGYTFLSATFEPRFRTLQVLVASDKLPEVEEGKPFPDVHLHVRTDFHVCADDSIHPEYRKITGSIRE